ncbi:Lrp/AsnC family transcriptional regulator [Candidatus Woesearchaeota archaeon]|nr:Lrp/AsnC family transcriptional regulator [Candidatus Woesearchaeota archaeon]
MDSKKYNKMLIDSKDKKILKALTQDGRMSISQLAKTTGLQRDSIARRLKKLKKEKVILNIIPIIDPVSLGYPNIASLLIRVKAGEDSKKKFQQKMVANEFVTYISKLIGKYDFYCSFIYEDTHHLNSIVKEIKSYIPDFIDELELFNVVEEPKYEQIDLI